MANKIGLITKWASEMFDEAYVASARISVLDANKGLLNFTGAKTVRIPVWSGDGMYDYRRANALASGKFAGQSTSGQTGTSGYGYQQGDFSMTWEDFTLNVDRAVQYRVELMDNEEINNRAVATSTDQINKQKIIPEVDAYGFSQIVKLACTADNGNLVSRTAAWNTTGAMPLEILNAAIKYEADVEVDSEDMIGFISTGYDEALRNSKEVTKFLNQGDFNKDIKFSIKEYEGTPLVVVPPRRFYTDVVLGAGYYGTSTTSKNIDLLMVAKSAVYHVIKYNKIRIFGPDVVQDFDGYKINARIYHDIFVPDNKKIACYCVVNNVADAPLPANKLNLMFEKGKATGTTVITGVNTIPGTLLYDHLEYTAAAVTIGSTAAGTTIAYGVEFTPSAATIYCQAVDAAGKVVAITGAVTPTVKA